ncbi:Phage-related lysozyme (muraminidase) (COG3772) [uncultured Mediterranean phage uvMED]|nr:Phage-related lysozyme (muraminidase) (COG3772) [uncultured Mediterranean phage uvMED]
MNKDLIDTIKLHEGCELKMYKDTANPPVWTIGYGHNLEEGIDQETADFILGRDLEKHSQELDKHKPHWRELPENVQVVILSMQFNMGWNRFSKFVKFWEAIENESWAEAGRQMQDSMWWGQVKTRGPHLRKILERSIA